MSNLRLNMLSWLVVPVICLLSTSSVSLAQGNFPLTNADLCAMKLIHYYPLPDKSLHEVDFEWTFGQETFTVKKGKAAIPADLMSKLLPQGETADEITGKWTLTGGKLVLSEIKAGTKPGRKNVGLAIYKTAPTVVRIGYDDGQYVFAVEK